MTGWKLIRNSLRFHWRSHLGTVLGAAIGSAVLIGALIVGDSVRETLKAKAVERTGESELLLNTGDRLFPQSLGERMLKFIKRTYKPLTVSNSPFYSAEDLDGVNFGLLGQTPSLLLPGVVSRQDGAARANRVQVFVGADDSIRSQIESQIDAQSDSGARFKTNLPPGTVFVNRALAAHLGLAAGDSVIVRVPKPEAFSKEAVVSPKEDQTLVLRIKAAGILPDIPMASFSAAAGVGQPFNAFLTGSPELQKAGLESQGHSPANLMLVPWMRINVGDDAKWATGAATKQTLNGQQERYIESASTQARFLEHALTNVWIVADFQAELTNRTAPFSSIELKTPRIFLDLPVIDAALAATPASGNGNPVSVVPILTYMVNLLTSGTNQTPYSMVTAVGPPYTPADMKNDEIVVNQWLADDLNVKPGDAVAVRFFVADSGSQLIERTNTFRVRGIVPLGGIHGDRTLMPDFPGVAKAESTKEWDAGFPLTHKIRDKDETYWNQHKGTPKAFVTLAAGQQMWSNRWGNLTSIRWVLPEGQSLGLTREVIEKGILANLNPADVGLRFEPVREQALRGASEGQDFGGLFIGFSFFLIAAALILMSMLFQFGLEQRATEIGTLLALGFKPGKVRRLLLGEGVALAFVGGIIGVVGGILYAKAMIAGLNSVWNEAIGGASMGFYITLPTLVTGLLSGVAVATITLWLALRKQGKRPARELLAEGGVVEDFAVQSAAGLKPADLDSKQNSRPQAGSTLRKPWLAFVFIVLALATIGAAFGLPDKQAQGGAFFGGGSFLLIGGILLASWWMKRLVGRAALRLGDESQRESSYLGLADLATRAIARRRKRSLATIALLASGSFLIVAVGANRLDANLDSTKRTAGTGGFAFIGESSLPIVDDPNTARGRENLNLPEKPLAGVSFVPMRVKDGDEASCLNLSRAQRPRLLGVNPELLALRGAFTFAGLAKGLVVTNGWQALSPTESWSDGAVGPDSNTPTLQHSSTPSVPVIPAIGDANSIQWAMGKKIGDTLDYVDERGQPFKVRIVGGVANSILQGQLLIDETAFKARFPSVAGYRMFLIDAPSNTASNVSAALSRSLQDFGLEVTPTATRLAQFNAVQNTYLGTFQILGGLGLLLGSAGLGVVVLRNVLERRGELAVMQAVGFSRRKLRGLVLREHVTLLWAGLVLGMLAAFIAVLPALRPGSDMPWGSLAVTLAAIAANGLLWTWLATRFAMRGQLLESLRNQ